MCHYCKGSEAADTKMVLTFRWDACVAQFRDEGRSILLVPAPYSLKRWLDVEAMVTRASLESPAESEASAGPAES